MGVAQPYRVAGDGDAGVIANIVRRVMHLHMRCLSLLLLVLVLPTCAHASDDNLCAALDKLRLFAAHSSQQRVTIYKQAAWEFACGARKDLTEQKAFCNAASESVGLEFTDVFPWLVFDCLHKEGMTSSIHTLNEYTGIKNRKKIDHLWAGWHDGTRLDIRFKPTGDFGNEPKFKDFWGNYEMVIWKP